MGLGGTAKKLQKVTNAAEELYAKMNQVIGQLKDLQAEVERTSEQVDRLEHDVAGQRALIEALAADAGVDVDAVLDEADLPPAPDADRDGSADGEPADDGAAGDASDGRAGGADATTSSDA